ITGNERDIFGSRRRTRADVACDYNAPVGLDRDGGGTSLKSGEGGGDLATHSEGCIGSSVGVETNQGKVRSRRGRFNAHNENLAVLLESNICRHLLSPQDGGASDDHAAKAEGGVNAAVGVKARYDKVATRTCRFRPGNYCRPSNHDLAVGLKRDGGRRDQ